MLQITPQMRILVALEAVDGRKGIDGLAQLCREKLATDPFSGCVFVFRSRSAKSIRLLVYDGQGFYLVQKRLQGTISVVAERRRTGAIRGSLSSSVVAGRRRSGHESRPDVAESELILAAKNSASGGLRSNRFSVTLLLCRQNGDIEDVKLVVRRLPSFGS
jgi:transposase